MFKVGSRYIDLELEEDCQDTLSVIQNGSESL